MLTPPLLLFLGDVPDQLAAKTAQGLVDWRRDWCVGQLRLPGCGADTGLPDMDVSAAAAKGARTMVIGVVNPGGKVPEHWQATILAALEAGLDVAAGMHTTLNALPRLAEAARRLGRKLIDVRQPNREFDVGTGRKRTGRRLLTVGTDCSIGKKYTALAIEKEMRGRGMDADFRATGQTGIFIAGRGVAIDAVVADFISGAAEWISPDAEPDHWDVIEGQGAILHPSFAGVTLGLLHGSQPDAIVVCHEPTRKTMRNVVHPIPTIATVIDHTLALGRIVNPEIRAVGIAVNTAALAADAAKRCLSETADAYGLPACDPSRTGVGPIVDRLISEFGS
jgi:uncharacterized NAD-dependent epimerase/dehydratase family protein